MTNNTTPGLAGATTTPPATCAGAFPALAFDAEEFCQYVADYELTEAQQAELLEALWAIMVAFVDIGFCIHPVQQASGSSPSCQDLASTFGGMLASVEYSVIENNKKTVSALRGDQAEGD